MEDDRTDPHVLANVLKSYLRELPEPLLTFDLHDEWLNAVRPTDQEERRRALSSVVARLPEENKQNVAYLVKFLHALTAQEGVCKIYVTSLFFYFLMQEVIFSTIKPLFLFQVNKMSSANVAIVIAPNLLWPRERGGCEEVEMGRNMHLTHLYSTVLDALVVSASDFFPQG